jgi:hypothetical protein
VDLCEEGSSKRQVTTEEGEAFAKKEGLLFVEASAKSGLNVEQAFEQAARDILEKIKRGLFDDDRVSLHNAPHIPGYPCYFWTRSDIRFYPPIQSPGVKLAKPASSVALGSSQNGGNKSCCAS